MQTVRPNALSNVVSQGKGFTEEQAFISSVMEALETWAAEHLPKYRFYRELRPRDRDLFAQYRSTGELTPRVDGLDLYTGLIEGVPISTVETKYVTPSPYQTPFDQTTTGLAAGFSIRRSVLQALSEVVERYSIRLSERENLFTRINLPSVRHASSRCLLHKAAKASTYVALESANLVHGLPVYRCWIADRESSAFPRLPSVGFGSKVSDEEALNAAILEAAQASIGCTFREPRGHHERSISSDDNPSGSGPYTRKTYRR